MFKNGKTFVKYILRLFNSIIKIIQTMFKPRENQFIQGYSVFQLLACHYNLQEFQESEN